MRRICVVFIFIMLGISAAFSEDAPKARPSEKISDYAAFKAPAGWMAVEKINQKDPQLSLEREPDVIKIRLAGGVSSRYKSPEEFLKGFEARSSDGTFAMKSLTTTVSGTTCEVYARKVAVMMPVPGEGGPVQTTTEEFCLVPAGDRFFILSYSYKDFPPDPMGDGTEVWREFLKTFKAKAR